MARDVLKNQILETVAHLVDENRQLREKQDAMDDVEGEIEELKEKLQERKHVLQDRRSEVRESEQRCLRLIDELAMLSDGQPRLPNITPTLPTDSKDPADGHSVTELIRFGLTEKQIEKLIDSKLAEEHTIKSIGDFIRVIGDDDWWHRKVRGWGETAVERATDALAAYRQKHPEPDDDDRWKHCRGCETEYPVTESACPECGSTLFVLADAVIPGDDEEDPVQGELYEEEPVAS